MSDISSFAEWEAQQQLDTKGNIPTEREQKLIDMGSEYRIWADMDSSNDYRSSASEDEEDGVELPVNPEKIVNGETMRRARVGLKMGYGLNGDLEIPGSTFEESQSLSQRVAREAEDEDTVSWALATL